MSIFDREHHDWDEAPPWAVRLAREQAEIDTKLDAIRAQIKELDRIDLELSQVIALLNRLILEKKPIAIALDFDHVTTKPQPVPAKPGP